MVTNSQSIKLIVYDFDGVLTANRVWVQQDGTESVACNRSDGWWIKEVTKLGIEQFILSTETNPVVEARAKKIGLPVLQGQSDKQAALRKLCDSKSLDLKNVCYIGNDVNDLGCFEITGYRLAPKDSHPTILKLATQVLPAKGGAGIVRHVHDWLMTAVKSVRPLEKSQWHSLITGSIEDSLHTKKKLLESSDNLALIGQIAERCIMALKNGKKIMFAGNGGSFADSIHLSAELVSKLAFDRPPLASIALGASNSNLTAIGNDYGYDKVFSREISSVGVSGDVFIAISTSGKSPNILAAVEAAKERDIQVFGFSGQSGGRLSELCPTIKIPSGDTARIQECHIVLGHIICDIIEQSFFK
jgi:D-sedoheptulose 7-phosphate isomerase